MAKPRTKVFTVDGKSMEIDLDYGPKRDYEDARYLHPDANLPLWDDLTEEQAERQRELHKEHAKDWQQFGEYIAGRRSEPPATFSFPKKKTNDSEIQ